MREYFFPRHKEMLPHCVETPTADQQGVDIKIKWKPLTQWMIWKSFDPLKVYFTVVGDRFCSERSFEWRRSAPCPRSSPWREDLCFLWRRFSSESSFLCRFEEEGLLVVLRFSDDDGDPDRLRRSSFPLILKSNQTNNTIDYYPFKNTYGQQWTLVFF